MGGMDGVMAAKTLREQGCGSIIILVTNYIQYAIDGYEFNAFHFLKKPVEYERFCRVVGQAMRLVYRNAHATLAVKCEEGLRQLTVRTISYCETDRGGVLLHLPGETCAAAGASPSWSSSCRPRIFSAVIRPIWSIWQKSSALVRQI